MANWGDWQNMPDYREGWQDKNKSGVARIARALDPTTYIPGLNIVANKAHDVAERGADMGNRVLSPVVGAAQKVTEFTNPWMKPLQKAVPQIKNIDTFIRDKPVDAAAIAAATFFTGGAASSALGAGGTAAAPAASTLGGAGGAASAGASGSTLLAPTTFSSLGTGLASSGAGAGVAAPIAGSTTGSIGTLGTVGTAAGNSLLTPAATGSLGGFANVGGAAPGLFGSFGNTASGLLSTAKGYLAPLNQYTAPLQYAKNLSGYAEADAAQENNRISNQQNVLSQRILDTPPAKAAQRKRITDAIMFNKFDRIKPWQPQ